MKALQSIRRHRIQSQYVNTGYYPDYDVLDNQDHWDDKTWEVVRRRMENVPRIQFFTEHEAATYEQLCNLIVGQDPERDPWLVPIINYLDEKMQCNDTDGYRFDGMPTMRDAFREGVVAIDESCRILFGRQFIDLDIDRQKTVVGRLAKGKMPGERWRTTLNADHFWHLLTGAVTRLFYAHPYTWNEIGYGGPAYPLGYMRLTNGEPEPWEVHEDRNARRYTGADLERKKRKKAAS